MTANVKSMKQKFAPLPTLQDVSDGKISLDDYEIAHGEDIPELTAEEMKRARPFAEMFPELAEAMRRARGERGPQIAPVKQRVGLRLDADVLARFRSTGRGWQGRINDILKQHLQNQHLNDAEGHKK
jgi:uncharacterized protein (DUF4415 family)